MGIGAVVAALLLAFANQHVEQVELGVARDGEVPGSAPDLPAVGVQHTGGLRFREQRVLRVIFRPEQALLFCRDSEEHDRAVGARLARECAGLFDQLADARRVVERAIVDRVTAIVRSADAEMVPVGRVDHRFVGIFLARQVADDIVRSDRCDVRLAGRA